MSFDWMPVGPPGPTMNLIRPPRAERTPAAVSFADALGGAVRADTLPSAPPAEALRDVEAAARRYDWLRENGRELRFTIDHESGRVRIEVRDLEGRLLREIPPSQALDAIAGGPFE